MFTEAREFLARAPDTGPSCVILDLNMPGLNGLELQEALAGRGRAEEVIFITGGANVPTCVQAMKAGRSRLSAETLRKRKSPECRQAGSRAVVRAMAPALAALGGALFTGFLSAVGFLISITGRLVF